MSDVKPASARSRWFHLYWAIPVAIVVAAGLVLAARGIRSLPEVASFLTDYPGFGDQPDATPVGFPAWLAWQHGLNAFFMVFILRTGWTLHQAKRPDAFWTRNNDGRIRTKGAPVRIGIDLWLHIVIDTLWVVNGVAYIVLLFVSGQWLRVVPTSWDVVPNAISAGLQYASLDWPLENGWVHYNGLQLISYFLVIFVAGPVAVITGLRISPGLAARLRPLDRVFPLKAAKKVHFFTMVFFALFIVAHVTLVLTTGAFRNLNHIYAARDAYDAVGFAIFVTSIVVTIVVWLALKPAVIDRLAGFGGTVRRMPKR